MHSMKARLKTPVASVESMLAVVELFRGPLKGVVFPGVDATVLQTAVENIERSTAAIATAQAELEAAQNALVEQQNALFVKVHQAMAYARVFAETNPELMSELERISLPKRNTSTPRSSAEKAPEERPDGELAEPAAAVEVATPARRKRGQKEPAEPTASEE
jgi:hypothetical protein